MHEPCMHRGGESTGQLSQQLPLPQVVEPRLQSRGVEHAGAGPHRTKGETVGEAEGARLRAEARQVARPLAGRRLGEALRAAGLVAGARVGLLAAEARVVHQVAAGLSAVAPTRSVARVSSVTTAAASANAPRGARRRSPAPAERSAFARTSCV